MVSDFEFWLRVVGGAASAMAAGLSWFYFRRMAVDAAEARTMTVQAMTIAAQSDLVATLKEQANAVQGQMRVVEMLSESRHRNLEECERARAADKEALATWDRFYGSIRVAELWIGEGTDAASPTGD